MVYCFVQGRAGLCLVHCYSVVLWVSIDGGGRFADGRDSHLNVSDWTLRSLARARLFERGVGGKSQISLILFSDPLI